MTWRPEDEVPSWLTPEQREAFWAALERENRNNLFRPINSFDADVPEDTIRGKVIALYRELSADEQWHIYSVISGTPVTDTATVTEPHKESDREGNS